MNPTGARRTNRTSTLWWSRRLDQMLTWWKQKGKTHNMVKGMFFLQTQYKDSMKFSPSVHWKLYIFRNTFLMERRLMVWKCWRDIDWSMAFSLVMPRTQWNLSGRSIPKDNQVTIDGPNVNLGRSMLIFGAQNYIPGWFGFFTQMNGDPTIITTNHRMVPWSFTLCGSRPKLQPCGMRTASFWVQISKFG